MEKKLFFKKGLSTNECVEKILIFIVYVTLAHG